MSSLATFLLPFPKDREHWEEEVLDAIFSMGLRQHRVHRSCGYLHKTKPAGPANIPTGRTRRRVTRKEKGKGLGSPGSRGRVELEVCRVKTSFTSIKLSKNK